MRSHVGEKNPRARLRASDVRAIRASRGEVTVRQLARFYGVSEVLIYKIWAGERWVDKGKGRG